MTDDRVPHRSSRSPRRDEDDPVPGLLRPAPPRRCGVGGRGSTTTAPADPPTLDAITDADVVVIAPSNPIVSIGPIRVLPGVDRLLAERRRLCRRGVPDRRRRRAQGSGRSDADRTRLRVVGRSDRRAVRPHRRHPGGRPCRRGLRRGRRGRRQPLCRRTVDHVDPRDLAAAGPGLPRCGHPRSLDAERSAVSGVGSGRRRAKSRATTTDGSALGPATRRIGRRRSATPRRTPASRRVRPTTIDHNSRMVVCSPVPMLITSPLPRSPARTRASTASSTKRRSRGLASITDG